MRPPIASISAVSESTSSRPPFAFFRRAAARPFSFRSSASSNLAPATASGGCAAMSACKSSRVRRARPSSVLRSGLQHRRAGRGLKGHGGQNVREPRASTSEWAASLPQTRPRLHARRRPRARRQQRRGPAARAPEPHAAPEVPPAGGRYSPTACLALVRHAIQNPPCAGRDCAQT
jgi:hypothetical protein